MAATAIANAMSVMRVSSNLTILMHEASYTVVGLVLSPGCAIYDQGQGFTERIRQQDGINLSLQTV